MERVTVSPENASTLLSTGINPGTSGYGRREEGEREERGRREGGEREERGKREGGERKGRGRREGVKERTQHN